MLTIRDTNGTFDRAQQGKVTGFRVVYVCCRKGHRTCRSHTMIGELQRSNAQYWLTNALRKNILISTVNRLPVSNERSCLQVLEASTRHFVSCGSVYKYKYCKFMLSTCMLGKWAEVVSTWKCCTPMGGCASWNNGAWLSDCSPYRQLYMVCLKAPKTGLFLTTIRCVNSVHVWHEQASICVQYCQDISTLACPFQC